MATQRRPMFRRAPSGAPLASLLPFSLRSSTSPRWWLGGAVSTWAGWLAFRRLVDPRQLTGKLAGGLPLRLRAAHAAVRDCGAAPLRIGLLALATSARKLMRAMTTIRVRGIARRSRSHRPHALNRVASAPAAARASPPQPAPATGRSLRSRAPARARDSRTTIATPDAGPSAPTSVSEADQVNQGHGGKTRA
jgi:hypothetical protein